jgi:hypothetical protein
LPGTVADLRRLPQILQDDVELVDVGEASWSRDLVAPALNALADLGRPLLHLYCLAYDSQGHPSGIQQIANSGGADLEEVRRRMVDELRHIPAGQRGFIIWQISSAEAEDHSS